MITGRYSTLKSRDNRASINEHITANSVINTTAVKTVRDLLKRKWFQTGAKHRTAAGNIIRYERNDVIKSESVIKSHLRLSDYYEAWKKYSFCGPDPVFYIPGY